MANKWLELYREIVAARASGCYTDDALSELTATTNRADPCPTCGGADWRETEGELWCEPCLLEGKVPVVAIKVDSTILHEAVWVVVDDLPRKQWPYDGTPAYTHREVQMLRQAGPNVLQWVHTAKRELGATTAQVKARHKGEPDHESA
jgi:hypothetical protein